MSVSFDSVDDMITCGTADTLLQENSAQTLSAWIYPLTYGTAVKFIVARDTLRISIRTVSGIGFAVTGTTSLFHTSTNNTIVINTWQHIAYTWTGTTVATQAIIYVNAATVKYSFTQNGSALTDNIGQTISIGASSTNGNSFPGYIAEVAVWNSVLTQTQVSTLAQRGVRGLPLRVQSDNLVAYWPLEDVANTVSADGVTFRDLAGTNTGTGSDGTNNTGCTGTIGEPLSYLVHIDKGRGIGRGIMQGGFG